MTYALTGDATLTQTFAVTNTGDVALPFSVGGHPAFNVPAPVPKTRRSRITSWRLPRLGPTRLPSSRPTVL